MPIDFPASPTNGQVYGTYVYDSSITAWRNLNTDAGATQLATSVGLRNIVPTSVAQAGGSASANSVGTVTFTGVSSVSLNEVFSSTYKNYRLLVNIDSAASGAATYLRFRSAGSDDSSASYQWLVTVARFTSVVLAGQSGVTYGELVYTGSSSFSMGSFDVMNPQLARQTSILGNRIYNNEAGSVGIWVNNLTQYTGFTLYPTSGNMTGTVQVFGYNN